MMTITGPERCNEITLIKLDSVIIIFQQTGGQLITSVS
jgi:hypothetical protein